MKLYLVDDEECIRLGVGDGLRDKGHEVFDFANPFTALEQIYKDEPDCVLCDMRMPGTSGLEVLRKIRAMNIDTVVIIITAYGAIPSAVECLKEGAFNYITKPFSIEDILEALEKAEDIIETNRSNRLLRKSIESNCRFQNMIGNSKEIKRVFESIMCIANTNCTVLIEGETGTGKELVADAIHNLSSRKSKPLIKVSCAIFSQELLESELFGHVKGAFTGAIKDKKGRFELSNGGSIFLDELDDVPLALQVKLLRFLQERTFERVGEGELLMADVRIIAATKVNLATLVEKKLFRPDLYYRLNVMPIYIPPLRERREDIPLLISNFVNGYHMENPLVFSPEVIDKMCSFSWPGNVRQLENIIERLVYTVQSGIINVEHLPREIISTTIEDNWANNTEVRSEYNKEIAALKHKLIIDALKQCGGNKKKAAQILKMPYSTFRFKLDRMHNSPNS